MGNRNFCFPCLAPLFYGPLVSRSLEVAQKSQASHRAAFGGPKISGKCSLAYCSHACEQYSQRDPRSGMDSVAMSLILWLPKRKRGGERGRESATKTGHECIAGEEVGSYLGRLANLLADSLPFVVLVLLYGIEKSGALRNHCQHLKRPQEGSTESDRRSEFRRFVPRLRRTLRSACPIVMSAAVLVDVEGTQ